MLKPILSFIVIIAISVSSFANPDEKIDESRRGFLRGLLAAGGAAAVATTIPGGGVILSDPTQKVPPEILRRIAKLKQKFLGEYDPTKGYVRPNLEGYIKYLKATLERQSNPAVRRVLQEKIRASQRTLEWLQKSEIITQNARVEKVRQGQQAQAQARASHPKVNRARLRRDLYQEFSHLPVEYRFFVVRSLVEPALLRKMAWQVQYSSTGNEALVLSPSEINFLRSYQSFLARISNQLQSEFVVVQAQRALADVQNSLSAFHRAKKGIALRCSQSVRSAIY